MDRVLFAPKSEPAVDWSVIEMRFQDISAPARSLDLAAELQIEPSATVASDPDLAHDLPQTNDRPVSKLGDPLSMLLLVSEGAVRKYHIKTFQNFERPLRSQPQCPANRRPRSIAFTPVLTNIQILRVSRTKKWLLRQPAAAAPLLSLIRHRPRMMFSPAQNGIRE
ncbi:hypothetical protein QCM80_43290 [Bradyrhizobium sp. SSUT112]|uniref:hypothetical protein n=1 Tax=Bradyrhizobium sp. SSUT112 TaxID=3040604 RepID=UPI0024493296|nr:hypothetical protein [Bradyrhizobium sp. SSUT112]MDH2357336.1 hypothetical protein [Bradyrhizobium sp. SSUT112]